MQRSQCWVATINSNSTAAELEEEGGLRCGHNSSTRLCWEDGRQEAQVKSIQKEALHTNPLVRSPTKAGLTVCLLVVCVHEGSLPGPSVCILLACSFST